MQNRWHFFLCACLVHEGRCNHVFSRRTDRLDGNCHSKIMSQALTAVRLKANQIQVITMSPECTFGISFWLFWAILIHLHSIWKLSSANMLLKRKSQYSSNHMALGVKSLREISHFTRANEKLMTLVTPLDSWVAAIGIPLASAIS